MIIMRFEDLEIWKGSEVPSEFIILLPSAGKFSKNFGLKSPIRNLSGPAMVYIAEGFKTEGNK